MRQGIGSQAVVAGVNDCKGSVKYNVKLYTLLFAEESRSYYKSTNYLFWHVWCLYTAWLKVGIDMKDLFIGCVVIALVFPDVVLGQSFTDGNNAVKSEIRIGRQIPRNYEVLGGLEPGVGYDTYGDRDDLVF